MELTQEQQAVLNGSDGEVMAKCLQTLVQYGSAFDAPRLVPIKSAHLTGSFKIFFYTAYYEIVSKLVEAGIRVKVPTTLNPRPGYDYAPQNRIVFKSQKWHEAQLEALGQQPPHRVGDQNLTIAGPIVQTRSEVHRISGHRVLTVTGAASAASHHLPRGDTYVDADRPAHLAA